MTATATDTNANTMTNGTTEWTTLGELVGQSKRSMDTIRRVVRTLGLDVQPRPELRKGRPGNPPVGIPSKDVAALLDLLKQDEPMKKAQAANKAKARDRRRHRVVRAGRLGGLLPAKKASEAAVPKLEQLRQHVRALAVLCRELEAEVTVNAVGEWEVNRWTVEKGKS